MSGGRGSILCNKIEKNLRGRAPHGPPDPLRTHVLCSFNISYYSHRTWGWTTTAARRRSKGRRGNLRTQPKPPDRHARWPETRKIRFQRFSCWLRCITTARQNFEIATASRATCNEGAPCSRSCPQLLEIRTIRLSASAEPPSCRSKLVAFIAGLNMAT